jgi:hypothetical protein
MTNLERVNIFAISSLSSLIVVTVNSMMEVIIRRSSRYEKHETQTKATISIAIKLTLARFFNSSILLVFLNNEPQNWFKKGDLAYDVTILICTMAIQAPIKEVLYITGRLKSLMVKAEIKKGKDCMLTQKEANKLCEG